MPFAENSYLLWLPGRTDAVVFDAGFEPDLILEELTENGLSLAAIVNTHGHTDHIAGNRAMKEAFPDAPIIIGEIDAIMLTDANENLSAAFGMPFSSLPADRTVTHGDVLELAGMTFDVRFTPGHSPGHVVFVVRDTKPIKVIGGDVLFRGSVGRTDFPKGSFEQLKQSIDTQLFTLPDDTVIYPGHGPVTTVGNEKRTNPYVSSV
jgi:glyoxylase-like metal-dependent hydrolase (beta-lactamase superfamily II)